MLVARGDQISDRYLILDSVLRVEVDSARIAEYSPVAMLAARVHLEGERRIASLVATTDCRGDSVPAESFDRPSLEELSTRYRREDSNVG